MTPAKLLTLLASRALKAGSQARLAAELGVSTGYLNDVMKGRKEAGDKILRPLGLERVVTYRRANHRINTAISTPSGNPIKAAH